MPISSSLLILSIGLVVIGESSLLIYKSINGRNYPTAAPIKIVSGRNLTLKCKDINNANNEVEWSRKTDNFEFENKYILNGDVSRINFRPFGPDDADIYTCKSLKYNVSKTITIILDDNSATKRRLKRTQYRTDDVLDFNQIKALPLLNVSDALVEFYKKKKKFKYTSPPIWIDNVNVIQERSEMWPGPNMFTSNIASNNVPRLELEYEELLKRNDYKNVAVPGTNEYGFLYFIAIIGGLFLFGGIMCMCVRNNPNMRARLERASSSSQMCEHVMCVRHRNTNPMAGCILGNLNPTSRIPTAVAADQVTVVTFSDDITDQSVEYGDHDENVDIPPSYAISVEKAELPPSYEEAIKIMLPSQYSEEAS